MRTKLKLALVAAPVAALSATQASAQAVGPSFATLTDAVTFDTAQDAVLAVGALAIGLGLVVLGIRKIMSMVRSA